MLLISLVLTLEVLAGILFWATQFSFRKDSRFNIGKQRLFIFLGMWAVLGVDVTSRIIMWMSYHYQGESTSVPTVGLVVGPVIILVWMGVMKKFWPCSYDDDPKWLLSILIWVAWVIQTGYILLQVFAPTTIHFLLGIP